MPVKYIEPSTTLAKMTFIVHNVPARYSATYTRVRS
jgi:hypothetical protein